MEFVDYSPTTLPALEQQRDALRKGLGRALQWAGTGHLDTEPLLDACLHDLRFDVSADECRGAWLWDIVSMARVDLSFRGQILEALQNLPNEDDAQQLCALAFHFASRGDEPLRKRLYEIVEQRPIVDRPWLGESEIVALDSDKGLLFAARVRGAQLLSRAWGWDDFIPVDEALKRSGENRVLNTLSAVDDQSIRRYRDAWIKQRTEKTASAHLHRERMRAISVDEIIAAATARDARYGMFRGWGMHADSSDLETVFNRLLNAQEPQIIANYLKVFSNRAAPRMDPRLFDLCGHSDRTVRHRAFHALAQNANPLVREFAMDQLDRGIREGPVVALFSKNYRDGDEQRLLDALQVPSDPCELHWLLMDVTKVLEANPRADRSKLGVLAYALTPCAACRFHAARDLHVHHVAPSWLINECRYDAESDTRRLEENTATGTLPPRQ